MKLTTKGRYAVTAMLDLALHQDEGPITLADISLRQGISLSYLEQLFARLRKQGLVASARGPGGGYRLGHPAESISVAHVINAVKETVDATRCGGTENCQGDQRCLTHDLWDDLSRVIYRFLDRTTLGELVQRRRVQEVSQRQDKVIVYRRMHQNAGAS
ncbi:MAG: Fe-S cluster assembly transcription factor [Gammaproteobacteria bacterium]|nr:Fe-S cluster assembly transcription factor [Gammaproteobacteria bacterium]MCI0591091.1 Fe-S cluster assembly transcription factor [Gammaproteobacteria bacterium]